jgi:N-acetylglucosamine malate deacetylase 1
MPSALAIFAHPDDIEFVAAGTLLLLKNAGWDIHYMNLSRGGYGSAEFDTLTTERLRLAEAKEAAKILGAIFHDPICQDMGIFYTTDTLKQVAVVVREVKPRILLTHSPQDYMEDHMNTSRLTVSAAFTRGMPNFTTNPERPSYEGNTVVYHALPHGLYDGLRKRIHAGSYTDTSSVHVIKRLALAAHLSQKNWLDVSQGMDSYLISLDELSQATGSISGQFEHAEGWRRHTHLGFSSEQDDPLKEALGNLCYINEKYERDLKI